MITYIILKIIFLSFNILFLWIGGYENKWTFKLSNNTYYEYYYELYWWGFWWSRLVINKNIRIIPWTIYRKNIYTNSKYRSVKSIIAEGANVEFILVINDEEPINRKIDTSSSN